MTKGKVQKMNKEAEIEAMRLHGHYLCHILGMYSDNIIADAAGEDLPHNGEDFKTISHSYHTKFERLLERVREVNLVHNG